MNAEDKQEMLHLMAAGRQTFLDSVHGLPEEDALRSPGENRWSILQIAEHVVVVEHNLLAMIRKAEPASDRPEITIDPRRENLIRERAADRARKVSAPELAHPTGRFATLADAITQFDKERAATLEFVESCDHDLRAQIAHHPILGPANCQEMLLMIAFHPKRHSGQIAEIRAAGNR